MTDAAKARPPQSPTVDEATQEAGDAVMGLDMVLVDGARGPLRRMVPPARTALRFGGSLVRRPDVVLRRGRELAGDLGRIVAGRSEIAPAPKDRRYADPAWQGNGLMRR